MDRLGNQMPFGITAALLWILIHTVKKARPESWERIPTRVRFLVPMLIGYAEYVFAALISGVSLEDSLMSGVFGLYEGMASITVHHTAKVSPFPYDSTPQKEKENDDEE